MWKVQREVNRGWRDIVDGSISTVESVFRSWFEARCADATEIYEGTVADTNKYLVYVIFQPDGLHRSTLRTCEFFRSRGYSPIVVSNAPLRQRDLDKLGQVSTLVIERPNYGYDFGAYRDALRILRLRSPAAESVVLMNDSIWFPLISSPRLLEDLESNPADYCGAVFETFAGRRAEIKFVHSYLMRISGDLFQNKLFWTFWENLRLTRVKRWVVRYGEVGLTTHLLNAGVSVDGIYTSDTVRNKYQSLNENDLEKVVRGEQKISYKHTPENEALLEAKRTSQNPRSVELNARRYIVEVHPLVSIRDIQMPFAKKGRDRSQQMWRKEFLEIVDSFPPSYFDPVCLDEIRSWD